MSHQAARDAAPFALGVALIVGLVLAVALAVGARHPGLVLVLLVGVAASVVGVRAAFPAVPMLWITFGFCTPLYSAFFATTLSTQFRAAVPWSIHVAYLMPLVAFVAALFARRTAIGSRLEAVRPGHRPALRGALTWLALSIAISGTIRSTLPADAGGATQSLALVGMMASMSALVLAFAADVAVLLAETGLLFRAFVSRMGRRVVPIFSFVVVFLFVAVVFGTLYALLDRFSAAANFSVAGEAVRLDFPGAFFFSLVTLSTIGYGDVTPVTHAARAMVVVEIIAGVVLMLFAFSEIAAYDPEAEEGSDDPSARDERSAER